MRTTYLALIIVMVLAGCGSAEPSKSSIETAVAEALYATAAAQSQTAGDPTAPVATASTATPTQAAEPTPTQQPTAPPTPTIRPSPTPRPTPIPIELTDVFPSSTELPHGARLLKEERIPRGALLGAFTGFVDGLTRDYQFERMSAGNMEGLTISCAGYDTDGFAFGAMDDLSDQIKANFPDGPLEDVAVGPFGHLSTAATGVMMHDGDEIPVTFIWVQQGKFTCQYVGMSWGTGPPTVNMTPILELTSQRLANWPPPTPTPAPAGTLEVEYLVTSSAKVHASLTYSNATGGTEQISDYVLPWNRVYTMRPGDHLYISVQNKSRYGSVTCQIKVNGVIWKESTSEGAFAIATCSGIAGR